MFRIFVCHSKVIVELMAVPTLTNEYRARVLNDLKAMGFRLGRLVNVGCHSKLQYERIVL